LFLHRFDLLPDTQLYHRLTVNMQYDMSQINWKLNFTGILMIQPNDCVFGSKKVSFIPQVREDGCACCNAKLFIQALISA